MIPEVLTPNVERGEQHQGPTLSASLRNVRMFERVYPHRVPDPIRQGDTPARPARWPMFVSQSIADWQAVMEDFFHIHLWAPQLQIQELWGRQRPFGDKANIVTPSAVAYGSLFQISPPYYYPDTQSFPPYNSY